MTLFPLKLVNDYVDLILKHSKVSIVKRMARAWYSGAILPIFDLKYLNYY